MDKKNQFEGIRVVEDEAQEEIVRLDVPDVASLARKEPSKEMRALPNMMGDADADEVPIVIESENEWLVAVEDKEVTSVPMGWFVLLFLAFGGVLLWAFWQGGELDESVDAGAFPNVMIDDGSFDHVASSLSRNKEAILIAAAAKDYEAMENVLRGFFAAKTIEERLPFVRHPQRVKPLMDDYYGRNAFWTSEYRNSEEFLVVSLESRPFVAMSASAMDGISYPILLEDIEEGYLVDWESFVSYQPLTFQDLIEKHPTEPVDMRVYGTFDNFYAYEFTEDLGYLCVRLNSRKSDLAIFGYVREGTQVASEMKKHLSVPRGKKKTQPFILKVRFLPNSKASRSVVIDEIVSTLWAYPTNPDEE